VATADQEDNLLMSVELTSGATLQMRTGALGAQSLFQVWSSRKQKMSSAPCVVVLLGDCPWGVELDSVVAIHTRPYKGEFELSRRVQRLSAEMLTRQVQQLREDNKFRDGLGEADDA
jgi:hypothetical protein